MKLKFNPDQLKFIKATSDILLKNSGITYLKDTSILFDKLEIQDSDFNTTDLKTLQLICDVGLKATGVLGLNDVLNILNLIAVNQK